MTKGEGGDCVYNIDLILSIYFFPHPFHTFLSSEEVLVHIIIDVGKINHIEYLGAKGREWERVY